MKIQISDDPQKLSQSHNADDSMMETRPGC